MKIALLLTLLNFLRISCETITIANIAISWTNKGDQTDFVMQMPLLNGLSSNNVWAGFGFNTIPRMGLANVVVCQSTSTGTSIAHYYNSMSYQSNLLVSSNPTIGISNGNVTTANNILRCSFTRDNSNSAANYFKITSQTTIYMIAAYGK